MHQTRRSLYFVYIYTKSGNAWFFLHGCAVCDLCFMPWNNQKITLLAQLPAVGMHWRFKVSCSLGRLPAEGMQLIVQFPHTHFAAAVSVCSEFCKIKTVRPDIFISSLKMCQGLHKEGLWKWYEVLNSYFKPFHLWNIVFWYVSILWFICKLELNGLKHE